MALTRQIRSIFEAEVHVLSESIMPVVYRRDCQRHVRRCQTVGVNADRYRYSRQIYREIVDGGCAKTAIRYDRYIDVPLIVIVCTYARTGTRNDFVSSAIEIYEKVVWLTSPRYRVTIKRMIVR